MQDCSEQPEIPAVYATNPVISRINVDEAGRWTGRLPMTSRATYTWRAYFAEASRLMMTRVVLLK
jgi:hypothetical protein